MPSEFHNIETRSLGQVRIVLFQRWLQPALAAACWSTAASLHGCSCVAAPAHLAHQAPRAAAECSLLHTALLCQGATRCCICASCVTYVQCPALDSHPGCLAVQAITTCVNFIFSFVIGQVYLTMLCHMEFGTYIFFAFWVAVMTVYVMFFLPETKGVPIEEMGFVWRWGLHSAASAWGAVEASPAANLAAYCRNMLCSRCPFGFSA